MARLHEYQGKALLREHGIAVPRGIVARTTQQAKNAAAELGPDVVMKVQAWITGRKALGGVVFASNPDEAASYAHDLLAMSFGNFPVTEILIEELIAIRDELFVSISIDDAAQAPAMLIDTSGGSGIEERAESVVRLPIDVETGVDPDAVRRVISKSNIAKSLHDDIVSAIVKLPQIAKQYEARSLEVNPLVTTGDGRVMAADCRMTIDDYAVFRHPELNIEIARELDHPATELERQAYEIENADHRGTFYFAQLEGEASRQRGTEASSKRSAPIESSIPRSLDPSMPSAGLIGFHGAGGGGSMMSMDAVTNAGFTLANFCDTSGNPSAAKVYRAARIILSQPGIVGYFGSGSGVASQEQFWSAYGLAKAFLEVHLSVPAVIRLGGNSEDRAVEILEDACRDLPAAVEGYKKDHTPAFCAERFRMLVQEAGLSHAPMHRSIPDFVDSASAYSFPIAGGSVWIDHAHCDPETSEVVIGFSSGLLAHDAYGKPALAVSEEEVAGKDSELIACEIECRRAGAAVVFVDLPIPLLDEQSPAA